MKLSIAIRAFLSQKYNEFGLLSINIVQKRNIYAIIVNVINVDMFLFSSGQSVTQIESEVRTNIWSDIDLIVNQPQNIESHPGFIASKLIADIALRASIKSSVRQSFKTISTSGVLGLKASYSGRIYGVDIAQTT